MKYLQSLCLPILFIIPISPNRTVSLDNSNEANCSESLILSEEMQVRFLNRGNLFNGMLINNQEQDDDSLLNLENDIIDDEYETSLASDLNLFPKLGATYSEKTEPRRRGSSSKKKSTLIFRQEHNSHRGQSSAASGRSSVTHPENITIFEKARIPIDPMKNPNRKPDDIQRWKWDKKKQCWQRVGEERIRLPNGKIITQREWQSMLIHKSRQA